MKTINDKQLLALLDEMNKDKFVYVGVKFTKSGLRTTVERMGDWLKDLKAKPIEEFKIKNPRSRELMKWEKYAIIIDVSSAYVNIYRISDIKHKIKDAPISKEAVVLCLNDPDEK